MWRKQGASATDLCLGRGSITCPDRYLFWRSDNDDSEPSRISRSRPRKSATGLLPQAYRRWPLDLLSRGGPAGGTDASAAARISVVFADVRAAPHPALGAVSPGGARLSRLWAQRRARRERLRLHIRSPHRRSGPFCGGAGTEALRALSAGLW